MATCPQTKALYEETIKTFTFRESDGITIPKSVSSEAYTLAIDIVIISTAREVYKNYAVTPAEGFYGNATLVMQDMLERKIPVNMSRQRLYYGRVTEAFVTWQQLVDWSYFQTYMNAIGESLTSLGTALGVSVILPTNCCALPDRSWIELPLREVYFKAPFGTQYKIEVTWFKALQIEDGCGNIRDPRSKMIDGDKDGGLPNLGTLPSVATDANNPFANLPLPSSDSEQGIWANSKSDRLNNIDPNNIYYPDSFGYFARCVWTSRQSSSPYNCRIVTFIFYRLVANGTTSVSAVNTGLTESGCGSTVSVFDMTTNTGQVLFRVGAISLTGTIVRSANLPSDEPEIISP